MPYGAWGTCLESEHVWYPARHIVELIRPRVAVARSGSAADYRKHADLVGLLGAACIAWDVFSIRVLPLRLPTCKLVSRLLAEP
ncbi:hypothetical protein Q31a_34330 [Aureliella helgolandensis]|uniref:Uncharacterized protein n=1 Tax=Aureliella helgolandensis TaxID=2527968 RepID=A0A518G953_9BACT|nr:hypothetical protein Q31a_34330 [Aureliella helgolandensis]